MERSCRIILILICISMYDVLFSGGEWIEVTGCHSVLSSVIQNQTSLPANEPGACLQWCGTESVALQNSSCLCFNDSHNMTKRPEKCCPQNCSGDETLKCGGNSSDVEFICGGNSSHTVSVYRERADVGIGWTSLQSFGCLTYSYTGETGEKLIPDNCTVNHPFHCYSEITSGPNNCNSYANLNNIKTWYEALEDCTSPFLSYLWPAHNIKSCNGVNIQSGQFWVAIYWWTKDGRNTLRSEMSSFKIDSPNIGLGIAIGVVAGFLISITIAYCRRRICNRESSRNMDRSYNSYL